MKLGRFRVTRDVLFEGRAGDLGQIFQNVFPVKIEWDFNGTATYTAISEWFEDIDEGAIPPSYEFVLHRKADNSLTIETRKL